MSLEITLHCDVCTAMTVAEISRKADGFLSRILTPERGTWIVISPPRLHSHFDEIGDSGIHACSHACAASWHQSAIAAKAQRATDELRAHRDTLYDGQVAAIARAEKAEAELAKLKAKKPARKATT